MANLFKKKFMRVPNLSILSSLREISRNAYVDWIIILLLSIAITLFSIIGGMYLYWEISTGNYNNLETQNNKVEKIFDIKELDATLNRFEIREGISERTRKGYVGATDPSK